MDVTLAVIIHNYSMGTSFKALVVQSPSDPRAVAGRTLVSDLHAVSINCPRPVLGRKDLHLFLTDKHSDIPLRE